MAQSVSRLCIIHIVWYHPQKFQCCVNATSNRPKYILFGAVLQNRSSSVIFSWCIWAVFARQGFLSVLFLFSMSVRSRIWCETVANCWSICAPMSSSAPLAFNTNDKKQSDVHKHVILDDIQVFGFIVSFCISWLLRVSYITKAFKLTNTSSLCAKEKCHAKLCEENDGS